MITATADEARRVSNEARDERGGINSVVGDRLDGWKEIAVYLRRSTRCVQRWERIEGLPILRHRHAKGSTVYAYRNEVDQWWREEDQEIAECFASATGESVTV